MSDLDYDDGGSQGDGMPEPDWDRYRVVNASHLKPAGDSLRWGARNVQTFDYTVLTDQQTEQFIRVQATDKYSRSWSLIGSLTLPQGWWNAPANGAANFGPGPYPGIITLVIAQGVGQETVEQEILLALGGAPTYGLCNTQNAFNGGPYLSTFSGIGAGATGAQEKRPFAAIGALIGNAIAVRARYIGGVGFAGQSTAILSAIVTPYAAGQGI